MARGDFGWIEGVEALLQCSWHERPYSESVQVTPSHASGGALVAGAKNNREMSEAKHRAATTIEEP
ncbi:hypothetical protein D3C80_1813130 [compost metagenome]